MKKRLRPAFQVLAPMTIAWLAVAPPLSAAGQKAGATKTAPAPRVADGHIDFSGIWSPDRNFIYDLNDALDKGTVLPLQPWAEKVARERPSKDDPEAQCLPTGVPRQAPYPWRIVQTATHMFFLFEGNIHSYRQIFLDGRKHPDDPDPTWYGHSVGEMGRRHARGGFSRLQRQVLVRLRGTSSHRKLHVIERYRRRDLRSSGVRHDRRGSGSLHEAVPLHGHSVYQHKDELMEYICNENNKDVSHIVGKDPRNRYSKP